MEILEWWNLIFLLPALVAVLYILLLAAGAMPHHDFGLDLHVDGDGADHDILNFLGLGRVPLALILITFFLFWGAIGWFANKAFSTIWPAPGLFVWPALVTALLGAGVLTVTMARSLGRLIPRSANQSTGARDLVGRLAESRYPISAASGSVQVYDQFGNLHEVAARVLPGEAPIAAGRQVILWRYDDAAGSYLVTQDDALTHRGDRLPAA